jgi:glutaredoxin 3
MEKIEIYTTTTCPYCVKAKKLLEKKGLSFEEIDVSNNPELREKMVERAQGRRTVPQIFINGHSIGGCDDLYALDAKDPNFMEKFSNL